MPRIASDDSFVCGATKCTEDYAIRAHGISFTELVWVAYDLDVDFSTYRYFTWDQAVSIPNSDTFSLTADQWDTTLDDWTGLPKIICSWFSNPSPGLRRIANEVPRMAGYYTLQTVLTMFDQDTDATNPGKMTFTDAKSPGSQLGLDDFQDGFGCGDMWSPIAERGASSLIMIR